MLHREHTHCMTGEKMGRIFNKLVVAYFENVIPATGVEKLWKITRKSARIADMWAEI